MILSMHRILNCPNYCNAILFILWQQYDAGLKDFLVKKIMYFRFSVLLECQVLYFGIFYRIKCLVKYSLKAEKLPQRSSQIQGFSVLSHLVRLRSSDAVFLQKLPNFAPLSTLTVKKNVLHKFYYFCAINFFLSCLM